MTSDDVAEWDSTNHVRLMVAIEAEFGIRFEVDEITSPESVGELIDLIASKLGTPAG
jgi:acyl carrier protein